jgi:iron complex outermembrane receptor protein
MVYTGSYLVRHIDQQADYSNYLTSAARLLLRLHGRRCGLFLFQSRPRRKPTTCYAPVGPGATRSRTRIRAMNSACSTSEDNRIRAALGAYWEKFVIDDNMNFNYLPIPQCTPANLAISAGGGPDCVGGRTDSRLLCHRPQPARRHQHGVRRGRATRLQAAAFFGPSISTFIPKVLTLTGGTRYFHYDEFEEGSEYYSATSSILNIPNGTCTAPRAPRLRLRHQSEQERERQQAAAAT